MKYYFADPKQKPANPIELPSPPSLLDPDPSAYEAGEDLAAAVNVAIFLGLPLLVTGEPGTGKTDLADSVSWQLRLGDAPKYEALKFETKSTSAARDLFYTFDALGRFHDKESPATSYLTFNALGKAILLANEPAAVKRYWNETDDALVHAQPRRSVVLIDEIDKAPRDFPNDLLNEIAAMFFRIPELRNDKIQAPKRFRPIVIITSNSEKHLPDAFLRRCVYFDISFPEKRLESIVAGRITEMKSDAARPWLREAIEFFLAVRDKEANLQKKPATAELLSWIVALRGSGARLDVKLRDQPEHIDRTLGVLIKNTADLTKVKAIVEAWLGKE